MSFKNILLVSTGLGMGGAEKQVVDLADKFNEAGNKVTILSLTGDNILKPKKPDVEIISLGMRKSPLSFLFGLVKARRIIKVGAFEVVHSHMIHANIFTRILRLFVNIPYLVCTVHSTFESGSVGCWVYKMTDFLCDLTTCVSKDAVETYVSKGCVPPDKVKLIYNGIDTQKYNFSLTRRVQKRCELSLNEEDVLLLAVGRLTEAKNYPCLLTAFSILLKNKNYKNVHLAIIGQGKEERMLKNLAEHLGLEKNIHWLGLRYDVNEWMSAMDFYVMSSSWEGMPLVLCEAMSSGGIVVSTDCGGVKEILGEYGFIAPCNDPNALVDCLVAALSLNEKETKNISHSGRLRIINKYSIDSAANLWLSQYSYHE